jgi:hypothetical protein
MREFLPKNHVTRTLGWLFILAMWAGFVSLKWLDLRDGVITRERFLAAASFMTLQVLLIATAPMLRTWRDRRPKPPPVYRSTILD